MKRCLARAGLGAFAAILMMGCGTYHPQSFWEVSSTKVEFEASNFKVRRQGAQGSSATPYLFGIPLGNGIVGIPLYRQDLQTRAMKDLHRNWDGKGACFLHNINVEWSDFGIPFLLVWHQNTITADIYEFTGDYMDYKRKE